MPPKNINAVRLGKLGAQKGGVSRWEQMSAEERQAHIETMRNGRVRKVPCPRCGSKIAHVCPGEPA